MKNIFGSLFLVLLIVTLYSCSSDDGPSVDPDLFDTWTLNTTTGPEGANANVWYISCQEDGQPVASCGTACIINDNSLHVSTFAGDLGAAYLEIGTGQTTTERKNEEALLAQD